VYHYECFENSSGVPDAKLDGLSYVQGIYGVTFAAGYSETPGFHAMITPSTKSI